jgi:hypothetical protein
MTGQVTPVMDVFPGLSGFGMRVVPTVHHGEVVIGGAWHGGGPGEIFVIRLRDGVPLLVTSKQAYQAGAIDYIHLEEGPDGRIDVTYFDFDARVRTLPLFWKP